MLDYLNLNSTYFNVNKFQDRNFTFVTQEQKPAVFKKQALLKPVGNLIICFSTAEIQVVSNCTFFLNNAN